MDERHELEKSIRLFEVVLEDAGIFCGRRGEPRSTAIELTRLFAIGVRSEANAIEDVRTRQRIDLGLRILEARANNNYDEVEYLCEEIKPLYEKVVS